MKKFEEVRPAEAVEVTGSVETLKEETAVAETACESVDAQDLTENEDQKGLKNDNRGIGVVEIVLILVVLVALVIIFKDKIMDIINSAFESITGGAESL